MYRGIILKQQLKTCANKWFASQAAAAVQESSSPKLSELKNGLKVVTANQGAYGARITLLVKTGSKDDAAPGLTHCIQATSGLTNNKNTAFLTTQLLSALGAEMEVIAGRENIMYTVGCNPNVVKDILVDVLYPVVLGAKFPWWEVRDVVSLMKYQKAIAETDPCYLLMESAHKASFSNSFGSPLLCPDYMMGQHTTEMLVSRHNSTFNLKNMVLAGTGISQDVLIDAGLGLENLSTGKEAEQTTAPKFVSSEVHVEKPSDLVHAALTFPGASLNNKNAVALSVLQHAMGSISSIKRSSGMNHGVVNAAVESATNAVFNTSTFSLNYADTGLFGVHVVAQKNDFAKVMETTAAQCSKIASSGLSDTAIEAAKQRLKAKICMSTENSSQTVEDIAVQAATIGTVATPSKIM
uniref:Peptidase M16 N-terminal domain-containing protein n=1 Tax=Ciona savignyi TaxID=51511 RepID=H2ZR16_CIOSA